MVKGVFTELDPNQMSRRLSLADIERLHFDGNATGIEEILNLMARSEKMRSRIDEPLEVRGEIPLTLPLNTTGNEAYTACFYAFNLNGLVVAGRGDTLVLSVPKRPASSAAGTNLESRASSPDPAVPARLLAVRSHPRTIQGQARHQSRPRHSWSPSRIS